MVPEVGPGMLVFRPRAVLAEASFRLFPVRARLQFLHRGLMRQETA